jgi:AcrR family transcriptional regulator
MADTREDSGRRKLRERIKRRRRRTPDQARQEILDAAERVFARAPPDQVGLKDVAKSAGISHALITHYFGTYGGLVSATLVRRVRRLRGRILEAMADVGSLRRPGELVAMLFDALEDPVHVRLLKWNVANDAGRGALALEDRGIALVAQQIAAALDPHPDHGGRQVLDTIELALLAVVGSAFGYAMMKTQLAAAIGQPAETQLSRRLQATIVDMLRTYLRAELGFELPT